MPKDMARSDTSLAAVENESEALAILYDVLSVLSDTKSTSELVGSGFSTSINTAIFQLKGVSPATVASEREQAYPLAVCSKKSIHRESCRNGK